MRVVQVGSVAGSAEVLNALLDEHVDNFVVPLKQPAAFRSDAMKTLAFPLRLVLATQAARHARRLDADLLHVHWVPNGFAGLLSGRPWILHARGSDIRGISSLRRAIAKPLLQAANAVLVSTPDLLPIVQRIRPDAAYLPNPIAPIGERPALWDVGLASRADPIKGSDLAHQALALVPEVRAWAMEGRLYSVASGAAPVGLMAKPLFHDLLASTRVVVGQLTLGVLGNVELEAMSAGRPVIAHVRPDWYGNDPPPILSARDPRRIADHVQRLLGNPDEAAAVGKAGREWVARTHGFGAVRPKLLELYARVTTAALHPDPRAA